MGAINLAAWALRANGIAPKHAQGRGPMTPGRSTGQRAGASHRHEYAIPVVRELPHQFADDVNDQSW